MFGRERQSRNHSGRRPPPRELTSKWGKGLENLTMPGGRRVTTEEGQKRSFVKDRGERKRVDRPEKDKVLLKVSFFILPQRNLMAFIWYIMVNENGVESHSKQESSLSKELIRGER